MSHRMPDLARTGSPSSEPSEQGRLPLSSSPRCVGTYPCSALRACAWGPSDSALRGLTIHPADTRSVWDLSKTNPPFYWEVRYA
jgi:hypothetical protein